MIIHIPHFHVLYDPIQEPRSQVQGFFGSLIQ